MEYTLRQEEIITAALHLLASGGLRSLTMKRIADAIGVTEPAVYRHFRSKSEIIKALLSRFDLAVEFGNGVGFEPVAEFIRARVKQVMAEPDLARVLFAEEFFMESEDYSRELVGMMHRHKEGVWEYLRAGQKAGLIRSDIGLDELFRIIMGPVRLLIKQWGLSGGGFDLESKSEDLLAALKILLEIKKEV